MCKRNPTKGGIVFVMRVVQVQIDTLDDRTFRLECLYPESQAEKSWGLIPYAEGRCMLFEYHPAQVAKMNMQGMTYPIDVLFISRKTVVGAMLARPGEVIGSNIPVDAVLELPYPLCVQKGIEEGARVTVLVGGE